MEKIKKLARAGEIRLSRAINTDMNYVARGLAIFSSQHTIITIFAFLFAIITVRIFPKETIGLYKYIISFVAFVTLFQLNGTSIVLTRAITRKYDGTFKKLLHLNFFWNLIIAFILFLVSIYYTVFADPPNLMLALPLFISAILLPISETGDLIFSYANGKRLFKTTAQSQIIRSFLEYVVVLAVGLTTYSAYFMGAAYFITHCALTVIIFLYIKHRNPPTNTKTDPEAKNLTTHGSIISVLAGVANSLDNILVFNFVGAAGLAIYAFASAVPSAINGYFKHISTIVLPKYSNSKNSDFRDMMKKSFIIMAFILSISIAYFFAAPFIYKIFFPQFIDSVIYSQVIMFMFVFSPILPSTYIDSQSSVKARYVSNIPVSIFKIIATVLGAALWGIWGVIAARLLSKIVIFLSVTYIAYRLNINNVINNTQRPID